MSDLPYIEPYGPVTPRLIPVDHDPFVAPSLVPVDHDPFIEPPGLRGAMPFTSSRSQELPPSQMSPEVAAVLRAQPGSADEAQRALWGMTGIPDIQQGAQAWQRGEYLPAFGQMAAGAMQFGALGAPVARGALAAGREALGAIPGVLADTTGAIRAFHGSPYDFDAFDMSKMGTGEGNQTYGHGLYFADREGVAQTYRPPPLDTNDYTLSDKSGKIPTWMAEQINQYSQGHEYHSGVIDRLINIFRGRMTEQDAQWPSQPWMAEANKQGMQKIIDDLGRVKSGDVTLEKPQPTGRMYEAQINADPEHMLDWDKPLAQQSAPVKAALEQLWTAKGGTLEGRDQLPFSAHGGTTGEGAHAAIATTYGGQPQAAEALRTAGIPGIRYFDQGSRGAGEGTHNYVVFSDDIIDILRKYGLAGLVAGGATAIPGEAGATRHLIPVDHDPFAGGTNATGP